MTLFVETGQGTYQGLIDEESKVAAFKGIRYAKAPVKELRWKAPVKTEPVKGIIDVSGDFGPSCIQPVDEIELASLHQQSEDCLMLNIWTRKLTAVEEETDQSLSKWPVMVFIHGGGYIGGGAADPLYDGKQFAANHDVILVTINYRCNVLGFLDLAVLAGPEYDDARALGILDQVCALQWVNENISSFGGDPANVTVFGESAGGASVLNLMVTDQAAGLFNKAICQSGNLAISKNALIQKQVILDFNKLTGVQNIKELFELTADQLRSACEALLKKYEIQSEIIFFPYPDGKILPENGLNALRQGAAKNINLLIGSNADEFRYWKLYYDDYLDYIEFIVQALGEVADIDLTDTESIERCLKSYPTAVNRQEQWLCLLNDLLFRVNSLVVAELQSGWADTYVYHFTWPSSIPGLGACHAAELPFVFNNMDTQSGAAFTGPNPPAVLAEKMQACWVNFATTGNPAHEAIPAWDKYEKQKRQTMFIDLEWHQESDPGKESREILSRLCFK